MNYFYSLLFLLIPLNLMAAEYYAVGKNALGQKIVFHESNEGIVIAVYNRRDEDPAQNFLVKEECPGNMLEGLQCLPNRSSPLSGATFKRCHSQHVKGKKTTENCSLELYGRHDYFRCVKGCKSIRVPKILADVGMP